MMMSVPQILKAVREALNEYVLPELKSASWAGSNVRASITLLAYAEDRLELERSTLLDTNDAMQTLLLSIVHEVGLPWLNDSLRTEVQAVLDENPPRPTEAAAEVLVANNLRYRKILTRIIRRSSEARLSGRGGNDGKFRADLHRCLAVLDEGEAQMTRRSRGMAPI